MRAAAPLLLIGLSFAACSNYTTTDKEACELQGQANCKKLDQCIRNGVVDEYGDEATCEKLLTADCKARFEANHTGEHSSEVVTCVSALASASCGDFEENTLDDCQPPPGTAALGAPCAYSTQCASSFCALVTNGQCGTCSAFSNAGDDCAAHVCSPGFTCTAATMTCQPTSAPGDPCDDEEPCGFALTCVTPVGANTGTCAASGQVVGTPCDPNHATAPGCDAASGMACSAATNTCVTLTYATAGQPCGNVSGTTVQCAAKSSCFGASGTNAGTCVALAEKNAACDTSVGPACALPAVCVTGGGASTTGKCKLLSGSACH